MMKDGFSLFLELYTSNIADIFVFIFAPLLWFCSFFLSRIHRWQISKIVKLFLMYSYVLLSLIYYLGINMPESLGAFFLALGPIMWGIIFVQIIAELIRIGKIKTSSPKWQEKKEDLLIRSISQLLILLITAWAIFHTTQTACILGAGC